MHCHIRFLPRLVPVALTDSEPAPPQILRLCFRGSSIAPCGALVYLSYIVHAHASGSNTPLLTPTPLSIDPTGQCVAVSVSNLAPGKFAPRQYRVSEEQLASLQVDSSRTASLDC